MDYRNIITIEPGKRNGKIIQKPMAQGKHSLLRAKLFTAINEVVEAQRIALAFPELRCTFYQFQIW